ncbi:hypothetical protein [Paracraurococcus lichenis]|uniref:Phasin domain-containing protein n=1 Tax=Paracraurococcus lichenis TaxID=3064888 RepID=A0ABT9DWD5_9PROT|nr:hypothetical protein [Paracraurococcus sp. LOR1-02]MDO9708217.1 hypothetical protein [Paracraurococcus sp. LOR1-02]
MPEKAQERMAERPPLEARPQEKAGAELPGRRGTFERRAAEAVPRAEPPQPAVQDEIARGMAALLQETTRGMRAAMLMPVAPGAGFAEWQEAMGELITGMMRNNLHLMQEVMRIYDPQEHAALLQKVMQQWFDAVSQGQTAVLRMACEGTGQVLKPLEAMAERQGATTH